MDFQKLEDGELTALTLVVPAIIRPGELDKPGEVETLRAVVLETIRAALERFRHEIFAQTGIDVRLKCAWCGEELIDSDKVDHDSGQVWLCAACFERFHRAFVPPPLTVASALVPMDPIIVFGRQIYWARPIGGQS